MAAQVWMLFESGNAAEVVLNSYLNPHTEIRPINAYLTVDCNRSFSRAALRGAETAYTWARARNPELKPQTISYDLKGLPGNRSLTGESGGIAFAVALASHLVGNSSLSVAATGEIMASADGGPIKRIEGINEKLVAAATLLPEGGWVFYPQDNDGEITEEVNTLLNEKRLSRHAVGCVDEALKLLFSKEEEQEIKQPAAVIKHNKLSPKHMIWAGVSLAIAVFLCLTVLTGNKVAPANTDIKPTSSFPTNKNKQYIPDNNHKSAQSHEKVDLEIEKLYLADQQEIDMPVMQKNINPSTIKTIKASKTDQLIEKPMIKLPTLDKGFE